MSNADTVPRTTMVESITHAVSPVLMQGLSPAFPMLSVCMYMWVVVLRFSQHQEETLTALLLCVCVCTSLLKVFVSVSVCARVDNTRCSNVHKCLCTKFNPIFCPTTEHSWIHYTNLLTLLSTKKHISYKSYVHWALQFGILVPNYLMKSHF
jgi:hypothetical protein